MKKLLSYAPMLYAAYMLQVILFSLPFLFRGYLLIIYNMSLWLLFATLLETIFIFLCIVKRKDCRKPAGTYAQCLPLLAFFHTIIIGLLVPEIDGLFGILHLFFVFIFCFIITFLYKSKQGIKVTFIVIHSLLFAFLLQVSFLAIVMNDFGTSSIIKQVSSSNGMHTATIISSDQGALGGNTDVYVEHNHGEINLGICKFSKNDTAVYRGRYGEYENMHLHWADENTLLINGKSYIVE